jgi:DNA mismatch repair protein MutS2
VSAFERVLTDVGDDQSLTKNLSTFSAHVRNLAAILDATTEGVLVLLDELAGGTDPREGEALAAAVLDSLCARGGAVVCTTHYDGFKALPLGDTRFENASVGFDIATMSPTFRLAVGVRRRARSTRPARRFGIPTTVLDRAERFLSREAVSFEKMVEKLEQERRAVELARSAAEREAEAHREKQRELAREIERVASKEKAYITKESEALLQSIKRAREDLRAAQARLRAGKLEEAELRAAAKIVDAVAAKVAIGGELEPRSDPEPPARASVPATSVKIGARVFVPRLRAEAEIVEILGGGQLRVALGPLKLLTRLDEIQTTASGAAPRGAGGARATDRVALDAASDPDVPISTSENTVDLRGLRPHEAIAMAEQFLDRALGSGRRVAFLIHGHGTGALREAVRDALGTSRYVARLRAGGPREGGEGVTVVWLR